MKMKLKLLAILTTFVLILVGCNADDGSEKPEDNKGEDKVEQQDKEDKEVETTSVDFEGITFDVPKTSSEHDLGDIGLPSVAYILDKSTGANFNVIAEKLPEEMELTLDDYIKIAIENSGMEYSSNKNFEQNGIKWNELESVNDDIPLNQKTFVHNNTAYIFSFGAMDEESYNESLKVFNEIIATVEVK